MIKTPKKAPKKPSKKLVISEQPKLIEKSKETLVWRERTKKEQASAKKIVNKVFRTLFKGQPGGVIPTTDDW